MGGWVVVGGGTALWPSRLLACPVAFTRASVLVRVCVCVWERVRRSGKRAGRVASVRVCVCVCARARAAGPLLLLADGRGALGPALRGETEPEPGRGRRRATATARAREREREKEPEPERKRGRARARARARRQRRREIERGEGGRRDGGTERERVGGTGREGGRGRGRMREGGRESGREREGEGEGRRDGAPLSEPPRFRAGPAAVPAADPGGGACVRTSGGMAAHTRAAPFAGRRCSNFKAESQGEGEGESEGEETARRRR